MSTITWLGITSDSFKLRYYLRRSLYGIYVISDIIVLCVVIRVKRTIITKKAFHNAEVKTICQLELFSENSANIHKTGCKIGWTFHTSTGRQGKYELIYCD